MGIDLTGLGSIASLIQTGLDKWLPDADADLKAKAAAESAELMARFQAITTEAQSEDPWTSRARPSFLYVVYILLLASIPYGIVSVFYPTESFRFAEAFKSWFEAIPAELYALFGAGYLGYAHYRSRDKRIGQ